MLNCPGAVSQSNGAMTLNSHTKLGIAQTVFYVLVIPFVVLLLVRNVKCRPRMAWLPMSLLAIRMLTTSISDLSFDQFVLTNPIPSSPRGRAHVDRSAVQRAQRRPHHCDGRLIKPRSHSPGRDCPRLRARDVSHRISSRGNDQAN
jgi:hypothetical protein